MKPFQKTILVLSLLISYLAFASQMRVGSETTVSFEARQAALTDDTKTQLRDLINEANQSGNIQEVQLAVWSDNPAPYKGQKLSKADRDLASDRAKNLKAYLKDSLNVRDVDTYNMATRPSFFDRTFNRRNAQLSKEMNRNQRTSDSKDNFVIMRDRGKPSNAVVVVILEE